MHLNGRRTQQIGTFWTKVTSVRFRLNGFHHSHVCTPKYVPAVYKLNKVLGKVVVGEFGRIVLYDLLQLFKGRLPLAVREIASGDLNLYNKRISATSDQRIRTNATLDSVVVGLAIEKLVKSQC